MNNWIHSFPPDYLLDEGGGFETPWNRNTLLYTTLTENLIHVQHVGEGGIEHWLLWTNVGFDDRAQQFDTEEELKVEAEEISKHGMLSPLRPPHN